MLGKLIKYEFKATAKIILLFYAALLVVALINYLVMPWTDTGSSINSALSAGSALDTTKGVLQGLLITTYLLFTVAAIVVSLVVVVLRFYKMLGDEGYLMFTLPVTTAQHIFSKLIVAVVWNLLSLLIVGISAFIVIGRFDVIQSLSELWREAAAYGVRPGLWLFCIVLCVLLYLISAILEFYAAISIGPHITKSRVGGSIIAFIIIYVATQFVALIGVLFLLIPLSGSRYDYTFESTNIYEMVNWMNSMALTYFIILATLAIVIGGACYYITHRMIDKKLNLN
jgi:hypothetical protein